MIWLWRIFFSFALASPAAAVAVSGRVRLVDSLLPAVRNHQDYSGVVVWLEPLHAGPQTIASRPRHATMEQKGKRFVPHILAVQSGTGVYFPNLDPIFHSAFSNFSGQVFDLGLYAPGTGKTVTFRRTGVVRIFCNIHPTMSAVIVVLKFPWFAISGPGGDFLISNVPPGDYQLHVFHERATPATLRRLEKTVTVADADVSVPLLTISETGYVEVPHKNKYGQDYPPVPDDRRGYSSERR